MTEGAHVSRLLRDMGFHGQHPSEDFGKRHDREGHDFSRAASLRKTTHNRGRAALQRRVKRPKTNRASAPGFC